MMIIITILNTIVYLNNLILIILSIKSNYLICLVSLLLTSKTKFKKKLIMQNPNSSKAISLLSIKNNKKLLFLFNNPQTFSFAFLFIKINPLIFYLFE